MQLVIKHIYFVLLSSKMSITSVKFATTGTRRTYEYEDFVTGPLDSMLPPAAKGERRTYQWTGVFEDGHELGWTTVTRANVLEKMDQAAQSESLAEHGPMVTVTLDSKRTKLPSGSQPTSAPRNLLEGRNKRSVVFIDNRDTLCFDRSLVVLTHLGCDPRLWKRVTDKRQVYQRDQAQELRASVGLPQTTGIRLDQVPLYETHLQRGVRIYRLTNLGPEVIYDSFPQEPPLCLLLDKEHYCPVVNVKAFLGERYWDAGRMAAARKPKACFSCKSTGCKDKDQCQAPLRCTDCNRGFKSEACKKRHQGKVCKTWVACEECKAHHKRFVPVDGMVEIDPWNYDVTTAQGTKRIHKHRCGHQTCTNCGLSTDLQDHQCFIVKKTLKKKEPRFFFFDFETHVESTDAEFKKHHVNLAVTQDTEGRQWVHRSTREFVEFLGAKEREGAVLYAHNGGKFDTLLILEEILARGKGVPTLLRANGRVITMRYQGFEIRDSYCHLAAPLSKFAKMFGLEGGKGNFPHLFNRRENWNYSGPYPGPECYGVDQMKGPARVKFLEWHQGMVGQTFDFQKALLKYCVDDVRLLREGLMAYRNLLMGQLEWDPLAYVTLSSSAQGLYIDRWMPKDSIEVLNVKKGRKQSSEEHEWVTWMEHRLGRPLVRQKKIGHKYVDAYDPQSKTICEYDGCLWHGGCARCQANPHSVNPRCGKTMHQLKQETMKRDEVYRGWGYTVVTCTSCDLKAMRKTPEYKQWLPAYKKVAPIHKRDALFGGRTDLAKTYYKVGPGEKMRYVDFTSVYPAVMKQEDYPVGAHQMLRGDLGTDVSKYFGVIKATVRSPTDLKFAVLPNHDPETGKLFFRLGAMTGTWTTPEVLLAVAMGYVVEEIHEVWQYERRGKLFAPYINFFLRVKQEASKRPAWVQTEADMDRYIEQYFMKEGIELDRVKVWEPENSGLRALAKLMLNCLWGKFCQRDAHLLKQTMLVDEPDKFFRLLMNESYNWDESNYDFFAGGERVLMSLQEDEDLGPGGGHRTNEVLGAFTTAYGRMRLHNLLQQVGPENVCYYDTDSCVYIEDQTNRHLHRRVQEGGFLGDYLGELTSEFDPDVWATEVVCVAPKSYALRLTNGETIVKCKGFTLSHENSLKINFESMKDLVLGQGEVLNVKYDSLRKSRAGTHFSMHTVSETKRLRFNYDKGRLYPLEGGGHGVLPWGHTCLGKRSENP